MKRLLNEAGQIGWPGLVGALLIAFVAVIAYRVLFGG